MPVLLPARPVRGRKKRVLIVDDSSQVRSSLARVIGSEGFVVLLASNGREAIEILFVQDIDLVLMDLAMPELNGWQALQQLSEKLQRVPVIVMTGQPHQRQWVERLGARALLEKPFEPDDMLALVRQVLAPPNPAAAERAFVWRPAFPGGQTSARNWGINE